MDRVDRLLEPGRLLGGALIGELLRDRLSADEPVAGQMLGAFRIDRELGRGGMGVVFLAHRADGAYEQEVAIKWLPAGFDVGQVELFRHERQTLAGLRHPHIAHLLDGGRSEDGHLWFAMERVDGAPVDRHAAAGALDWTARVRLLLPVIEAVQFAHGRLLVHRDIKPGNVLVDSDGRAKLLDFGVAALLGDAEARCAYTDGYASPEQHAGAPPVIASDVWQLGRLLQAVLAASSPGRARLRWPRDLDAVLERATATDPAQRYPTAAALQADLERVLARRPVAARPPTLAHRLQLLGQAHPLGTLASVLALLAFVVIVGGLLVRLAHQRDTAEHARAVAEAVNAFLEEDLLPGADPLQAGSGDITVAAVAERALARAEPRLHGMPEVAAQVELSLGDTLSDLGRFTSADRAYRDAITHLARVHGPRDERVLRARLLREQNAIDRPSMATAEPRLRALRADALASLGAQAGLLVEIDSQLARAAFLRDDFALCARRFAAVLPRLPRAEPAARGDAFMGLSLCESRLGDWPQALEHARQAHALEVTAHGPQHPLTLETNMALESALVGLGRYDEAVAVLHALVDVLGHRYGPDHPTTLTAVHDLGYALTCAGQPEAAEPWLQRAADGRARTLGAHHPWYAMSETVLGMALVAQHRYAPAAQALSRARAALGKHAAATPFVDATLLENEADLSLARHDTDASARFRAATIAAQTLYPIGSQRLAVLRLGEGLALLQAGDAATGRPMLREALTSIGDHPDCRAAQIAQARVLLGD